MANYERGVYEPPSDDIRVFDGAEDDIDEEGSRLPLLIVIALLVLAAFAGVVWLAYTQGVQRGRTDAPRMIAAASGPMKTAPGTAGGEEQPYQGLKIYEQPAPADDDTADEDGAPQPPTQLENTSSKPEALAAASATTAPPLRPQQNVEPAQTTAAPVKTAQATIAPPKDLPAVAGGPATAPPRSLKALPKPVATAPKKTIAAPVKATVAAPPTAPAASGSALLQIGAYKSEAEANSAWKAYEAKHPIAGGYSPDVKQVDLGEKGTWYRLRIGPFDGKAAASAFCDKLKADGANCFPAAP